MRRYVIPLALLACLAGLTVACYGRVLFHGEQFSYRDAAHFYYPLYQRVQAEWRAGRWPLWEPEENSGMPLMGNPTAAVLYPGKLIYAVTPYPLGARLYVVAHTLLAFAAMVALLRTWNLSWSACGIAGLAYAFSGPILFQYCNIIYLVGAAWVPFGFRSMDLWLRCGRRRGILELALVLAMEMLGGDAEAAYLTGLVAGAYAIVLAWRGENSSSPKPGGAGRLSGTLAVVAAGLALAVVWVAATLGMAWLAPRVRTHQVPPLALPWMTWVSPVVVGLWGLLALLLVARWIRRPAGERGWLLPMLGGLCLSAGLAGAISAAQLFPVMEFAGLSARAAGEGPHDIYPFSLLPWRVVEFVWPNPFGTSFNGNHAWVGNLPPASKDVKVWIPSLYVGGLTVVLALGAAGRSDRGTPGRAWMTTLTLVSLLGAFGEFTSPLVWARFSPKVAALVGPLDPFETTSIRLDGFLRDGDGSLYWMMATFLPGFRQFRFPSKLLTLTVMGLAALAGFGWDDLLAGVARARRRSAAWTILSLVLTAAALGAVALYQREFVSWLSHKKTANPFGPFDPAGGARETVRGLTQALAVLGTTLTVILLAYRRSLPATVLALALLSVDLAAANARFVLTAPQNLFDHTPKAVEVIRAEEAKRPSPGPYRVHRVPIWNPIGWTETRSVDRVRDFVEWERGTIQPKYGINDGVNYTLSIGVAELYDYEFFFAGFPRQATPELAKALNVEPGSRVVYYPRRGFDMWTSRYFVLPYFPRWGDEHRGIAAFFDRTERLYPAPDDFRGPGGAERETDWIKNHDFQIFRNQAVYPRAWVVHEGRYLPTIRGMNRADRARPMEELLFANDPVWNDPTRVVYDPKVVAWLENDDRAALAPRLRGRPPSASEAVTVVRHEPDTVELDATLESPGLVVLADVYYPGWSLTIDGRPAPIYRVNRAMRGCAVEAGRHRIVYTYRPTSFYRGLRVSAVGLVAFLTLAVLFSFRPTSFRPRSDADPGPDVAGDTGKLGDLSTAGDTESPPQSVDESSSQRIEGDLA